MKMFKSSGLYGKDAGKVRCDSFTAGRDGQSVICFTK